MIKAHSRLALTALAFGALSACGASQDAPSDAPVPAKSVQQLMANTVQPAAEKYWDLVQYISDEDGFHEIEPSTQEEWDAAQEAALGLADLGRLLATPEYSDGRDPAWLDFTQGLIDVSALAEKAALSQDPDEVFTVGGTVYNVCKGCHQVFPPEVIPDGMSEEEFFESQERG